MSYQLLGSNLIAIANAESPRHLVTLDNSHLHPTSSFCGRIIKWIRAVFYFFFPCLKKEQALFLTLKKTKDLFFKKMQILEKVNDILRKGLKRCLKGKEVKDDRFKKAREELIACDTYLGPLLKDAGKARQEKVLSVMCRNAKDPKKEARLKEHYQNLFYQLKFYLKIFAFEEVTSSPIPFDLLRKMSLNTPLTVKEIKKVEKWLAAIEKSRPKKIPSFKGYVENNLIHERYVHRMLCKIVEFINHSQPKEEKPADIEELEARLVGRGYEVFYESDPKNIVWRNSVQEGDTFEWNGQSIVVGAILLNPEKDPANPLVFAVKDDPSIQITLYSNEAWGALQRYDESILQCGVRKRKVMGLSPFGRIVVEERLYKPVHTFEWLSRHSVIVEEDKPLAKPIVELLRGLVTRVHFTPQPLRPQYFAFNAQKKMRTTRSMVPGEFCPEVIENFAFSASKANRAVFSHLITESGIGKLKSVQLYHRLFDAALTGEDVRKSITLNGHLRNQRQIEWREEFYFKVQECMTNGYYDIVDNYRVSDDNNLRKELGAQLKAYYLRRCPARILLPQITPRAVLKTLCVLKPPLNSEAFQAKRETILAYPEPAYFLEASNYHPFYRFGVFDPGQIKIILRDLSSRDV